MDTVDEFRQDLVSGDWVLFATKRGKRPHEIKKREPFTQPKETCPFEDLVKSGNEVLWAYPEKDPILTVIRNKFPAVEQGVCVPPHTVGPFNVNTAIGTHDVIVFRDHDKHMGDYTTEEFVKVIQAYKKRYTELISLGGCTAYVLLFHNYGKEAGASIAHPHSQIISMPILPPDVSRSLHGSYKFYKEQRRRVYDVANEWEKTEGKRIVYENDFFMAFCPYVSKNPYEVRIFAKDGHAHFDQMPEVLDKFFADAFLATIKKIRTALDDPAYNFFIHTAPPETSLGVMHEFYTWHMEIIPKIKIDAGFELGTGVEINAVSPDAAAELLRNTAV